MEFRNKNVVITGGTSGIGFITAMAFINSGANVWITGRSVENLEKASLKINNSELKTIVADTSSLKGIDDLEKYIVEAKIKIDVLYINAGIGLPSAISETTEEDFDLQFNTNVKGSFFTLQRMIQYLNNGSAVIFTSSTAASASIEGYAVYSATKSALNKIAKVAANELAERNIRVNIISPGPIATEGFEKDVSNEVKKQLASGIALKRMGKPEEIANTVLFLASSDAAFITGTEIIVDGGFLNYAMK